MQKYRLFAPGPTPIPESVRLRMAEAIIHHRTPAFETIFGDAVHGLSWAFQSKKQVLMLAGTGTAAMDGSVCNFLSSGSKALFVNGGKFGERWGKILRAYGCEAIEVVVPWGEAVDPQKIADHLKRDPNIRAVYVQASETSTGVEHPVRAIADLCKSRDQTLCVVDGITAVGVFDVPQDEWGIDVLVSGSQKAFMLPPGLAFVGISDKAWRAQKKSNLPRFYLDFESEHKAAVKRQNAFTSAVSLVAGLSESLRLMQDEGLPQIFARHRRLAHATRQGLLAMGCEPFSKAPVAGITSVVAPAGVDSGKLVACLRDRFNLTIAGGQDQVKGKIFRVAHMGHFDDLDVLTVLAAIEMALHQCGFQSPKGAGVAEAQRCLADAGASQ